MPQPPNLGALLQQAQKMQQEMMEAQEKLKDERVEATAGGGMVKVVMTGDLELKELTIDPDAVDPEDVEMLQDMVMAAINEAMRQASDLQAKAAGGGVGGMDPAAALDVARRHGRPRRPARRRRRRPGGAGRPGAAQPRGPPQAEVATCSPRPSSAWSPSWASCPASATARRSGWRSTSCARAREDANALADAIRDVKEKIGLCEVCFNLAEGPRCTICLDERRDAALICVVEEPADVLPIERTHEFRGRYHVLGGALSPIDGVEPEDLKLAQLYARVERADPPVRRGRAGHEHDDDRRGDRAPHRRRAAHARARRDGHAAGLRPAGRRRPRVRRRGHARPRVRRPPRALDARRPERAAQRAGP